MKQKIVAEGLTMMSTAFSLVAALAWNEAIKSLIEQVLPKGQGIVSLFFYAVIVTVLAVIMMSRLSKMKSRFEDQNPDQKIQ